MIMSSASSPKAFGPLPSARQLAWHEMEFYGFIHFTVNAFTGKEWGYGDEEPGIFNPAALDCDQWAEAAKAAGMKGLILTTKHHDGFCLFPSKYTKHSVKASPWKKGKGDLVKDFAKACRRAGLKVGFYLSPWDRNHAEYGRPAYVEYYRNQMRELLTGYGELFEIWLDGANGGDGFYGGAREQRKIDASIYYDWAPTFEMVRSLQPNACIFGDGGPDLRWVGNENGLGSETCWQTYERKGKHPGCAADNFACGHRDGSAWCPAECDVSIRPGWFYHKEEDEKVKGPEALAELYFASVGRGSSLLLNLPPDQRGLVHEKDVEALKGMRKILDRGFAVDFTKGQEVSASNIRATSSMFGPEKALDGKRETFYASDDNVLNPEITVSFSSSQIVNTVSLREFIPLGQRVDEFQLEARVNGAWSLVAKGTSIGARRLMRFAPLRIEGFRLKILKSSASPCISELALHNFD